MLKSLTEHRKNDWNEGWNEKRCRKYAKRCTDVLGEQKKRHEPAHIDDLHNAKLLSVYKFDSFLLALENLIQFLTTARFDFFDDSLKLVVLSIQPFSAFLTMEFEWKFSSIPSRCSVDKKKVNTRELRAIRKIQEIRNWVICMWMTTSSWDRAGTGEHFAIN